MRVTDWTARMVTQHCGTECGCEAVPSLRTSMEGGVEDACCSFPAGQYWQDEEGVRKTDVEL